MNHEEPKWLRPMLEKWTPDAISLLMQCIKTGLRKGEVSANDVRVDDLEQKNVTGGVFKSLRRFGFVKSDRRVRGIRPEQHGRDFPVWILADRTLAHHLMEHMRRALVGQEQETTKQMVLL